MISNKLKSNEIIKVLIKRYGEKTPVYLNYNKKNKYEFLFAVMLSAQCKDERVNKVTKNLFIKYDSLDKIANAKVSEMEKQIHSLGFYHNKAKNMIECAKILIEKFDSKVPKVFDDLVILPGVGRKTASVVISQLYNIEAIAVDTHVARVSNFLFSLGTKNPYQIEMELKNIIDKKYWKLWNTHIIALGREICIARKPKCDICPLKKLCDKFYTEVKLQK